jgi:hypothetical protein
VRITEEDVQPGVDAQLGVLAISAPWSHVNERRSWAGSVTMTRAISSRTASAP